DVRWTSAQRECARRGCQQVALWLDLISPRNFDAELLARCHKSAVSSFHETAVVNPTCEQCGDLPFWLRASRADNAQTSEAARKGQKVAAAGMIRHGFFLA